MVLFLNVISVSLIYFIPNPSAFLFNVAVHFYEVIGVYGHFSTDTLKRQMLNYTKQE